ncbi:hypothetical protein GQ607_010285 [Colletotrichum asianum]|uniref:Uncharacterized protein n=1 Tax=Colletotrichum asianum TaxID=702518 RepID=A0A8H3WAT1_9PEZI|nr:hypothetical protein GQ607_010285 [Colletotrichum asianum]
MRQSFFLAQPPTGATQSWQSPGNGNAILLVTRPGRTLPYGYTLRCFCSSAPPAELIVLSPTRRRRRRSAQRRRKTQAASTPDPLQKRSKMLLLAFRDKGRFAPSAPLVAVAATAPLQYHHPLPHHLASFASRRPLDP